MEYTSLLIRRAASALCLAALIALAASDALAQTNVNVRIMAANLNGNTQSILPFAIDIYKGLKADVVCIQEFNYNNNTPADFRALIDDAFGTDYSYYRETGSLQIPNGIISRYPIIAAGRWVDTQVSNRGFAWARLDLPGSNDLYAVSVHLLTDGSKRPTEASNLKALILANFPTNAWIVIGGDFNADSRGETCVTTFASLCPDAPQPTDAESGGNNNSNANRNKPYDYVLASHSLTNYLTNVVFASHSFPKGLVFDSRVYTPLTDVSPIVLGDSGQGQHMAILKDFSIPAGGSNAPVAPFVSIQPQSQTVPVGGNATFTVTATGTAPLAYQWWFNGTNISGALTNTYTLTNAQATNNGNYTVVITNLVGSVTSSVAILTVSNIAPSIITDPAALDVFIGNTVAFSVAADGTAPLAYQWRFNSANISGATNGDYSFNNAQTNHAGNYTVVVTNSYGSVTSSVAILTVMPPITNAAVIAQWNFNSVPADASTTTGSTAPSVGSGTASLVGSVTSNVTGFAGGDAILDPTSSDNTAWNTTTYPASGNNKTAGSQFAVSTAGKENIAISWSQQSSKTGGKYFRIQYSTNGGTGFVDFPTAAVLPLATNFFAFTNSLAAIPGVNNNSNFVFRIVAEFESTATNGSSSGSYVAANSGSAYATTGTTRFDMVTVSGTAIIAALPAIAPVLSAPTFNAGQFQMLVTGTASSNYVVQATTNLSPANWTEQFTNAAPFTFTDASPAEPQKFYRAIVQP